MPVTRTSYLHRISRITVDAVDLCFFSEPSFVYVWLLCWFYIICHTMPTFKTANVDMLRGLSL